MRRIWVTAALFVVAIVTGCGDGGSSTSNLLYVADSGASDISIFKIGSDGSLSSTASSTHSTGNPPIAFVIRPDKKFLYLLRSSNNDVQIYSINSKTGVLTFST